MGVPRLPADHRRRPLSRPDPGNHRSPRSTQRSLYPRLRKLVSEDKTIYDTGRVRNEVFLALDYYVTESSRHASEYSWWFRKTPLHIRQYCTYPGQKKPGIHAFTLKEYQKREKTWRREVREFLDPANRVKLDRGTEYATPIIHARLGGEPFLFNGNVPNAGLIDNLPAGSCVEVPVVASRRGLGPMHVGPLPSSVLMLTHLSATAEQLAVEGALAGDAHRVFQAIAHDPLTAAKLSLGQIRTMVQKMFRQYRAYLPQFKNVRL